MTACTKCGKRVWKPEDGAAFIDRYIGDAHANCEQSLEAVAASKAAIQHGVMAPSVRPIFSKRHGGT